MGIEQVIKEKEGGEGVGEVGVRHKLLTNFFFSLTNDRLWGNLDPLSKKLKYYFIV